MRDNAHCGPILVTDDDDLLRTYVIDLLEQAGYAASGAASGQQALELARRERPSLVVLDVLMPDLSGYEVCRQLRGLYGPSLPIMFVSGERGESADRVAGLLLGADDYLPKPFAADELLARIYSLVRRLLPRGAEARSSLTERELEVLRLLADGKRIADIASDRPRDQPKDGPDARRPHLREVRRAQPDAGARVGLPSGPARASLESSAVTLALVTAGESHGPALVAVLIGLPAGLILDKDAIDADLRRRQQGYGRSPRQQIETDEVEVLAGLRHGRTLGTPLALVVRNRDHKNWTWGMSPWPPEGEPQGKGTKPVTLPRPGHADLAGVEKYGLADVRDALERASARHTAVAVAAGAVAKELLRTIEIEVAGSVVTPDLEKRIDEARAERDTVGGVVQVTARGVPPGLGSYATKEDRLDARLAAALMGIQAVKGVEIGEGFALAELRGSQAHDEIQPGRRRTTNRAGGIEGGMSNGEEIVVRAAMKPLPTLMKPLASVDLDTGEPANALVERSDVAAVEALAVVAEAAVAFELARAAREKFGGDALGDFVGAWRAYRERIGR